MVLESNTLFLNINRFVVSFIDSLNHNDGLTKEAVMNAWKLKQTSNKLKTVLRKTGGKPPRRVMNKYLYFCQEERRQILSENPGMSIKNVTCELGKRWQAFQANPDVDRLEKITALFEIDKKRYETDKMETQKAKPKHAKTPYLRFCADMRSRDAKISMKELGAQWSAIKCDADKLERYKLQVDTTLPSAGCT